MNGKLFTMAILTAAFALTFTAVAQADTLNVCPTACDYTNLKDAIDAAEEDDIIQIYGYDTIELDAAIVIDKSITLIGMPDESGNPVTTITQGTMTSPAHELLIIKPDQSDSDSPISDADCPVVTIKDLEFQDIGTSNKSSVVVDASNAHFKNCVFSRRDVIAAPGYGGAVFIRGFYYDPTTKTYSTLGGYDGLPPADWDGTPAEKELSFTDCLFVDNIANNGGAVAIREQKIKARFNRCIFDSNHANERGAAVYAENTIRSSNEFVQCMFIDNDSSSDTMDGSTFYNANCKGSFKGCTFTCNNLTGNTIAIYDKANNDIYMEYDSPTTTICNNSRNAADLQCARAFDQGAPSQPSGELSIDTCLYSCDDYDTDPYSWLQAQIFKTHHASEFDLVDEIVEIPDSLKIDGKKITLHCTDTKFTHLASTRSSGDSWLFTLTNHSDLEISPPTRVSQPIFFDMTNGNGIRATDSSVYLTTCDFAINERQRSAPQHTAVSLTSSAEQTGTEFKECNFSQCKGAVVSSGVEWVNIAGCKFTANQSDKGGAVYIEGAEEASISSCYFDGNTATASANVPDYRGGGAVYVDGNSELTIKDTEFNNNTSQGVGGALRIRGGVTTIKSTSFLDNTANNSGGGAFIQETELTLEGLDGEDEFIGNISNDYGGGLAMLDIKESSSLTNCNFGSIDDDNAISGANSALSGGGVRLTTSKTDVDFIGPVFTRCNFYGNSSDDRGGGVYNLKHNAVFESCTFQENMALEGGGIANKGRGGQGIITPTFNNCEFIRNSAGRNGGGMWNYLQASPKVKCCRFAENVVEENTIGDSSETRGGAGMYNEKISSPTVDDCVFIENKVKSNHGGGGMLCWDDCEPLLRNCYFEGNEANGGGALSSRDGSRPQVRRTPNNQCDEDPENDDCYEGSSQFINNHARNNGGAVYINEAGAVFKYVIFIGNTAANYGGAVRNLNSTDTRIESCRIYNNDASNTGGVSCAGDSSNEITVSGPTLFCANGESSIGCNSANWEYEISLSYCGTSAPCAGDINGDFMINAMDFHSLLINFGLTGEGLAADLDDDDDVDAQDFSVFLVNFGTICDNPIPNCVQ